MMTLGDDDNHGSDDGSGDGRTGTGTRQRCNRKGL